VQPKPGPEDYIQRYLIKAMRIPASRRTFCSYGRYGSNWLDDTLHVYVEAFLADFGMRGDTAVLGSGGYTSVALKVVQEDDSMRVVSHQAPRDGSLLGPDVHRIFPRKYWDAILGGRPWTDSLEKAAAAMAREFYRNEH
jgi:hypothetical protein